MEPNLNLLGPLFEKAEQFSKKNIELMKLKFLDKAGDLFALIMARILVILTISFFLVILSIAIALWLGSLLGKNYYGFFAVSFFYGFASILLWFFHPLIKNVANNWIIKKLLN